ncbi:SHOCT domain-containing protein [Ectothiorhodospiraceae bacterium 2226]|nr:SHOCT domain-containing protein [Ectothiorhodospiraceae bacterium 2226]
MGYDGWGFGMHALWWLFWVVLIVGVIFALLQGSGRREARRETPYEILQRRYAEGEISKDEYEERKRTLGHDG